MEVIILPNCPKCGTQFNPYTEYGIKKFCSEKCSNSRTYSQETKEKIRQSLVKHYSTKERITEDRKCVVCHNNFSITPSNPRKTCSPECQKELRRQINARAKGTTKTHGRKGSVRDDVVREYIVYKTINTITNQYYIGVHKGTEKRYFGSGLYLKRSIKKYGKSNFVRETLHDQLTEKEAFELEEQILKECLGADLCMNIAPGGCGGAAFSGRRHSEETKKKLSEITKSLNPRRYRDASCMMCGEMFTYRYFGGEKHIKKCCSKECVILSKKRKRK